MNDIRGYRVSQTAEIRNRLKEVLEAHLEILEKEDLTPKDRIELIGKLLPYCLNKIATKEEDETVKKQVDPLEGFL